MKLTGKDTLIINGKEIPNVATEALDIIFNSDIIPITRGDETKKKFTNSYMQNLWGYYERNYWHS